MDRLSERLARADVALASFEELAGRAEASAVERDAAILRFQYSLECVWKAAQHRLREHEGLDAGSPKQVVRCCLDVGIFDAETAHRALALIDDRNLTVHTYDESLATALAARLPAHAALLRTWLQRLGA